MPLPSSLPRQPLRGLGDKALLAEAQPSAGALKAGGPEPRAPGRGTARAQREARPGQASPSPHDSTLPGEARPGEWGGGGERGAAHPPPGTASASSGPA